MLSAGCSAGISFLHKKRVFGATLDAVLAFAWSVERGIAVRVGPAWSYLGVGTGLVKLGLVNQGHLQSSWCCTVGLCSTIIFLKWLKRENCADHPGELLHVVWFV